MTSSDRLISSKSNKHNDTFPGLVLGRFGENSELFRKTSEGTQTHILIERQTSRYTHIHTHTHINTLTYTHPPARTLTAGLFTE